MKLRWSVTVIAAVLIADWHRCRVGADTDVLRLLEQQRNTPADLDCRRAELRRHPGRSCVYRDPLRSHQQEVEKTLLQLIIESAVSHVRRTATLLFIASMCAEPANGQVLRPYVSGAIEVSSVGVHSPSTSRSLTFEDTSDDNMVLGVVGEAGSFLRPNVALGGQVDVPFGRTVINQHYGIVGPPYDRQSRYREWTAFGVLRGYARRGPHVRVGGIAGVGVVAESSLDQTSPCRFAAPLNCTGFGGDKEPTRFATGVTVGIDLAWDATPHISVGPQFRVVWVDRGNLGGRNGPEDMSLISLGVNQFSYRASIGIRLGPQSR